MGLVITRQDGKEQGGGEEAAVAPTRLGMIEMNHRLSSHFHRILRTSMRSSYLCVGLSLFLSLALSLCRTNSNRNLLKLESIGVLVCTRSVYESFGCCCQVQWNVLRLCLYSVGTCIRFEPSIIKTFTQRIRQSTFITGIMVMTKWISTRCVCKR